MVESSISPSLEIYKLGIKLLGLVLRCAISSPGVFDPLVFIGVSYSDTTPEA